MHAAPFAILYQLEESNAMRMKKLRLACLAISVGFIAACSTTRTSAPVVDRTQSNRAESVKIQPSPQPSRNDSRNFYTVKRGDTLLHIALEYGQNYRDLVTWNNLANANDIKVDQVLRVAPPDGSSPPPLGAQTGSVASTGVEVRPLASAASTPAPSAAASASNKTGPRADKRPYSETNLAELQKPDAAGAVMLANTPVTKVESKPIDTKPNDRAADAPSAAGSGEDAISWIWPAEGRLVAGFEDGKKGIDIAGKSGQSVMAASGGKVMYAGSGIRGYGNLVIVKHTSNLLSAYAHNKTILVKEGQTVSKGQKIAEMGNSDSDSVKLHFEIRQQGKPVDPSKFLPSH